MAFSELHLTFEQNIKNHLLCLNLSSWQVIVLELDVQRSLMGVKFWCLQTFGSTAYIYLYL